MASRNITQKEAAAQLGVTSDELRKIVNESAVRAVGSRDLVKLGVGRRGAAVCVRQWGRGSHRFVLYGYAHDGSDVRVSA